MPDCTLVSVTDAKKLIRAEYNSVSSAELSAAAIEIVEEYHDTYPADYVIRTEPTAGSLVSVDDSVRFVLVVSKGRKISNTTVPELEGLTLADAKKRILNAKLALGKIYYEESAVVGAGRVMKAGHAAGETVAQDITSIDLWVSIGSAAGSELVPDIPTTPKTEPDTTHTGTTGDSGHGNAGNTGSTEKTEKTETDTPQKDPELVVDNTGNAAGTGENTGTENPDASSDIAGLLDMRNSDEN